jgi:hypothetical protein
VEKADDSLAFIDTVNGGLSKQGKVRAWYISGFLGSWPTVETRRFDSLMVMAQSMVLL